jgi:diguanylate cyclase (GGDEF)-like protein/PAS domain S-box-containing protein
MTWQYLYIVVMLIAVATSALLAFYAWQYRNNKGAMSFVWLILAMFGWSISLLFLMLSNAEGTALIWSNIRFIFVACAPVIWLAFVLQYTDRQKWLAPRWLGIYSVIPFITILMVWTNKMHGLFMKDVIFVKDGLLTIVSASHGFWLIVTIAYSYLLIFVGILLLVLAGIRSFNLYRSQTIILISGALIALLGTVPVAFKITDLQYASIGFIVAGILLCWALFRYRLFDMVPIARDALIERMTDGMIVLDMQDRIVDLNPAAQTIIGIAGQDAIGKPALTVFNSWPELVNRLKGMVETNHEVTIDNKRTQRYYDVRISPLTVWHGYLTGRMMVLHDTTEQVQLFHEVRELATRDPLTGLYNRRHFFELGEAEFARARRYQLSLSVLVLDIDCFKQVNDIYGHMAGDEVLQTVANVCRESLREVDVVGRYGGDEFVILMPETDLAGVQHGAQRLCEQIADAPVNVDGDTLSVTVSMGVASIDGEYDIKLEKLVDRADRALLVAKKRGRNRVIVGRPQ